MEGIFFCNKEFLTICKQGPLLKTKKVLLPVLRLIVGFCFMETRTCVHMTTKPASPRPISTPKRTARIRILPCDLKHISIASVSNDGKISKGNLPLIVPRAKCCPVSSLTRFIPSFDQPAYNGIDIILKPTEFAREETRILLKEFLARVRIFLFSHHKVPDEA